MAHDAVDDSKVMLERMKASGLVTGDDRQIRNLENESGISPMMLAHSMFPIDSTNYKGSFKLRDFTRTRMIINHQIVLKYLMNLGGSYNEYGKGMNEMGMFDFMGTLILQGNSNHLMQLYRTHPIVLAEPVPFAQQPAGSKKSSKVFQGVPRRVDGEGYSRKQRTSSRDDTTGKIYSIHVWKKGGGD